MTAGMRRLHESIVDGRGKADAAFGVTENSEVAARSECLQG